jgi:putative protease
MKRKIELLAPGGDVDSIKAAIAAGADAIYCGLNNFNARNRATNIKFDDLYGIVSLAHRHDCKIFLTLNILIIESEIPALIKLLNRLVNTKIDGLIVQDLGLFYLLANHFKDLNVHASTQMTTHNEGQIKFLSKLGATRVNLSRELNIEEIRTLTSVAHENNTSIEVFVHGSNCISFSGICYISSVFEGKSGNRGRCSQPCRDRYITTPKGKNFPLNLKDNSAYSNIKEIYAAGVDSIKVEGRIKKFHYVYTVIDSWKKQLDKLYNGGKLKNTDSIFYEIFNRDYTNSFLQGDINKSMYIDNPRDNSAIRLCETQGGTDAESVRKAKNELHAKRTKIIEDVEQKIKEISIEKSPLALRVSGEAGTPLRISVQTPDSSFVVYSETNLIETGRYSSSRNEKALDDRNISPGKNKKNTTNGLDMANLSHKFSSLDESEYYIAHLDIEKLRSDLFIPAKELTSIKKKILFNLNGAKKHVDPIKNVFPKKQIMSKTEPTLGVLISSTDDIDTGKRSSADIFFELPNCFADNYSEVIDNFTENRELIPWFPAVLIGKDYHAALDILRKVKPKLIVTNNTGIAYEACQQGIPWIAGPHLNIINSFSILCLKEHFNCCGAFISNEISKNQLKNIIPPENFKLYYSIYHPIPLITSRQCLFHQVIGCEKSTIDEECILKCNNSSSITNQKGTSLYLEKTEGMYHGIYNNHNYLNTDIVTDLPYIFSGFLIDLRNIKTETDTTADKSKIIDMFKNLLAGNPDSMKETSKTIHPSTNAQYLRGI